MEKNISAGDDSVLAADHLPAEEEGHTNVYPAAEFDSDGLPLVQTLSDSPVAEPEVADQWSQGDTDSAAQKNACSLRGLGGWSARATGAASSFLSVAQSYTKEPRLINIGARISELIQQSNESMNNLGQDDTNWRNSNAPPNSIPDNQSAITAAEPKLDDDDDGKNLRPQHSKSATRAEDQQPIGSNAPRELKQSSSQDSTWRQLPAGSKASLIMPLDSPEYIQPPNKHNIELLDSESPVHIGDGSSYGPADRKAGTNIGQIDQLLDTIQRLTDQVNDLEGACAAEKRGKEAAVKEVALLRGHVEEARRSFEARIRAQEAAAEAEGSRMRESFLKELEENVKGSQNRCAELEKTAASWNRLLGEKDAALRELDSRMYSAQMELDKRNQEIAERDRLITELMEEQTRMRSQLTESAKKMGSSNESLGEVNRSLNVMKVQNQQLQTQLDHFKASQRVFDLLKNEILSDNDSSGSLGEGVSELEMSRFLKTVYAKVQFLNDKLQNLTSQNSELISQYQQAQINCKKLQSEIQRLRDTSTSQPLFSKSSEPATAPNVTDQGAIGHYAQQQIITSEHCQTLEARLKAKSDRIQCLLAENASLQSALGRMSDMTTVSNARNSTNANFARGVLTDTGRDSFVWTYGAVPFCKMMSLIAGERSERFWLVKMGNMGYRCAHLNLWLINLLGIRHYLSWIGTRNDSIMLFFVYLTVVHILIIYLIF